MPSPSKSWAMRSQIWLSSGPWGKNSWQSQPLGWASSGSHCTLAGAGGDKTHPPVLVGVEREEGGVVEAGGERGEVHAGAHPGARAVLALLKAVAPRRRSRS